VIVGVDARAAVEETAGRGRYVRELLRALAARDDPHRYRLYTRREWNEPLDDRFEWRPIAARDPWWNVRAARAANRECDVMLSSNSYLTVWFLRIPGVPVVYDLVAFDRALRPSRRSAAIERLTLGFAVRRAAGLVAISEATARDLAARRPETAGRVTVTPLGLPSELAGGPDGAPPGLPERYVLAVGTLEPRKNLPRLVEAYGALPDDLQRAHPLVVVGRTGWQTGETMAALEALGDRCRRLGVVSDAELRALYRHCTVFCYPSLGEGFGLPVLEAMAAGAPVLTSDRSSLPEVGGDAAEYVDPTDTQAIAAGLEALLRDPERRGLLSERARLRAREFTWARTAALTLQALERAAGAR
jgi:glycosyltransferase involved in cell wall biosynthesis